MPESNPEVLADVARAVEPSRRSLLLGLPGLVLVGATLSADDAVGGSFGAPFGAMAKSIGSQASVWAAAARPSTGATAGSGSAVERAVMAAIGGPSNDITVAVLDRRTGTRWSYRGNVLQRTGSVAKAFVVMQALRKARAAGTTLTSTQLQQARLAITRSDNASASALYTYIGGHAGIVSLARALGLRATAGAKASSHWGTTLTTSDDLVVYMQCLHVGHKALHADDRALLLQLMSEVVSTQRWGVGSVPSGVRTRNKNGWMAVGNPWVVNSFGDARGGGRDYVLAFMQTRQPDQSTGIARARTIGRAVYTALAKPLT